ncbi:MAG TPA: folylpolyglutamate synthase/dihydrofolate synthase family protein [Bacteroidales bacterium]|jgi:dihydrofolate synthase/folylpolyglutamate synthase|nr:folylpolyglutamate synthase/dihydrofolate synthase family protein [Bacteroidales bacterium]HQB22303.1 folylpolyglutamate synthase/dihydrofolate synthase family protein [Bacteroidales bacterium]
MNYQEVIEFMFNSLPMYQRVGAAAYKANLDNTLAFDKITGSPHKKYKTIHIAGTNGKGSVSHSLASILQEAGYKTGLYTSPHLTDYRERIRVNGKKIEESFITEFINSHKNFIKNVKPSFFEMSVALAFKYFELQQVEVAVIEVGMGGRLDSTNIILPELSVITNIGLDHTQFLGNSLAEIAGEKAGIIKQNIPVVIGERQKETEEVFLKKAKEKNSKISFASDNYACKILNSNLKYSNFEVEKKTSDKSYTLNFNLSGKYQEKNLATILETVDNLRNQGFCISDENLKQGLENLIKNTGFHGRWETLNAEPLTICDTGHNKDGLSYTIEQLLSLEFKKLRFVLGFVNDKNVDEVLKLFPKNAEYYFCKAQIPRALDEKILLEKANLVSINGKSFENVSSAYHAAKKDADKNDVIFIGGSTFVVADLLQEFA